MAREGARRRASCDRSTGSAHLGQGFDVVWGWSSDRSGDRRWHLIAASVTAVVGFAAAGVAGNSFWALPAMCLALVGIYGTRPTFWPLPSIFLSGTAAAGGIALINSIGNLGGYAGPFVVGWIRDSTNSFQMALYFLAGCSLASGALVLVARRASDARPVRLPDSLGFFIYGRRG